MYYIQSVINITTELATELHSYKNLETCLSFAIVSLKFLFSINFLKFKLINYNLFIKYKWVVL